MATEFKLFNIVSSKEIFDNLTVQDNAFYLVLDKSSSETKLVYFLYLGRNLITRDLNPATLSLLGGILSGEYIDVDTDGNAKVLKADKLSKTIKIGDAKFNGTASITADDIGVVSNTDFMKFTDYIQQAFISIKAGDNVLSSNENSNFLELISGENIQISSDSEKNTITITAEGGGSFIGPTSPENTNMLWIDTTENGKMKYYNGKTWIPINTVITEEEKSIFENSSIQRQIIIPTTNWVTSNLALYKFMCVVPVASITESDVPNGTIEVDDEKYAQNCGLCTRCITSNGAITFYADSVPSGEMRYNYILYKSS